MGSRAQQSFAKKRGPLCPGGEVRGKGVCSRCVCRWGGAGVPEFVPTNLVLEVESKVRGGGGPEER